MEDNLALPALQRSDWPFGGLLIWTAERVLIHSHRKAVTLHGIDGVDRRVIALLEHRSSPTVCERAASKYMLLLRLAGKAFWHCLMGSDQIVDAAATQNGRRC